MQATCDARSRFISFNTEHPGSANDAIAHAQSSLPDLLADLPLGIFFVVGVGQSSGMRVDAICGCDGGLKLISVKVQRTRTRCKEQAPANQIGAWCFCLGFVV